VKQKNPLQPASPINLKGELWQPDTRQQNCSHAAQPLLSLLLQGHGEGRTETAETTVGRRDKALRVGKESGRRAGHQKPSAHRRGANGILVCLCATLGLSGNVRK